jgi:hypothetical protein
MGHMEIEKRIEDELAKIKALDSQLDAKHTPYLKNQLRRAGNNLDDALTALKHKSEATNSRDELMWLGFAEVNIQHAVEWYAKVKAACDVRGGTANIREFPV